MSNFVRAEDKLKRILSDSKLYIESFMQIVDKNGKSVPFKLNKMQKSIYENTEKYNIILKSRQGGGSVFILAKALYLCMTKANTHCMMLSHNMESTRNIFNKAKTIYYSVPKIVRPKLERNNRQELAFSNGSVLSCATMGKKDNGRGATLTLIHVSELAFVGDQAKKQLLSLEQALIPNGEIWIESTASGIGNYFHELWNKSVNKESMYNPLFFNYLDSADMFIEDHKQAMQIYENLHGHRFSEDDLTDEEKELMEFDDRFTLPIICWRRMKVSNSSESEFNQEFPLTSEMAFVSTGSTIFNSQQIHERLKHLPKSTDRKQLRGLPDELKQYVNRSLRIYEKPETGHKYSIGVDCSEGIGQDYSALTIIDCETNKEVAHFRSNKIPPHKFATVVFLLGKYFNYGLLVIEKASAGTVVLDRLKHQYKYTNIYKSKLFDERGKKKKRIGFVTSDKTRSILINGYREAFEEGEILVNSKDILSEMLTFIADFNGKIQHIKGSHDDSLFSAMLAVFGLSQPHYK